MEKYLSEAIREYERQIESGQPFYMEANVLMDIEEYYEKSGKSYEAERLMRFAEKLHPQNEEVLIVKAYREKTKGHWTEALAIVRSIPLQEMPDVQLFYAEWEIAGGKLDKAEQRINSCIAAVMKNEDYDFYLDLGEIFLDYGYQKRALKYLLRIPQKYTFRKRVDELMADAYFQIQEYDKSIEAAQRLVDANPYDALSWVQLADIQQKCKKYEDCISSCDYALAIDEKQQRAMSLKTFATFALKRYSDGLQLCQQYANRCPNDYSLYMYAGEQLFALNKIQESIRPLQNAFRLCSIESPDHVRILNDLVYMHIACEEYDEAEELMVSLCMLGHSLVDVYLQLSNIYKECKLNKLAADAIIKILDRCESVDQQAAAIEQLFNLNCIESEKRIWMELAQQTFYSLNAKGAAYTAFAMYQLKEREWFYINFQLAETQAPEELAEVFSRLFGTRDLLTIRQEITKHFEQLED